MVAPPDPSNRARHKKRLKKIAAKVSDVSIRPHRRFHSRFCGRCRMPLCPRTRCAGPLTGDSAALQDPDRRISWFSQHLDAGALVKLCLPEPGSDALAAALQGRSDLGHCLGDIAPAARGNPSCVVLCTVFTGRSWRISRAGFASAMTWGRRCIPRPDVYG